jgi:hypothetical protein
VFGKAFQPPPPDDPPLPDYASLVERELRVADFVRSAAIIWAPILASLQAEQQRMRDRGLW